jgi:hypothetical protein
MMMKITTIIIIIIIIIQVLFIYLLNTVTNQLLVHVTIITQFSSCIFTC